MTIITKPISDKKVDKLEIPLVDNEHNESLCGGQVDLEAATAPDSAPPHYYTVTTRLRARRVSSATTACLFLTALLVLSVGIVGSVYLYRQFCRSQATARFRGWCNIPYDGTTATMYMDDRNVLRQREALMGDASLTDTDAELFSGETNKYANIFREEFDIDLEYEQFEKIDVPDFRGGRRGRFIHDFNANKTGIVDMDGKRCFVMPLNRKRVLPPKSMFDLISKMWEGYYEVDTEVIRETMRVVTPPIADLKTVGDFISRECRGLPTYMLEKVVSGVYKRSVDEGVQFSEFAGMGTLEFHIIDLPETEPVALAAKKSLEVEK